MGGRLIALVLTSIFLSTVTYGIPIGVSDCVFPPNVYKGEPATFNITITSNGHTLHNYEIYFDGGASGIVRIPANEGLNTWTLDSSGSLIRNYSVTCRITYDPSDYIDIFAGYLNLMEPTTTTTITTSTTTMPCVGCDLDEHGCNPSAGYQWCELLGKCIRPWEEPCEDTPTTTTGTTTTSSSTTATTISTESLPEYPSPIIPVIAVLGAICSAIIMARKK